MADHHSGDSSDHHHHHESLLDKIADKFHHHHEEHHSSSSSDGEKPQKNPPAHEAHVAPPPAPAHVEAPAPAHVAHIPPPAAHVEHVPTSDPPAAHVAAPEVTKGPKIYRLFGRERPVHSVLGAGKQADVLLWRNKKVSGAVLGGATAIWVLFELMEYHLLTLVCHCLILSIAVLFLWSNAAKFINKSPPKFPEVIISEDLAVNVARALRNDVNRTLATLREIASGHDLKKFLGVIAGLWFLSIVGSCFNFLTLFYIVFVLLHTVPVLYEKYEDKVDAFGEKAEAEFKKYYAVVHANYLSKIPKGPLKDKKLQ